MKIGKKLALANALMAISALIAAVVLSRAVVFVDQEFKALNERTLQVTALLEKIRFSGLRIVSSTNEYLLLSSMQIHHEDKNPQEISASLQRAKASVESEQRELDGLIKSYHELVQTYFPDELEHLEKIEAQRAMLGAKSEFMLQAEFEKNIHAQLELHQQDFESIVLEFLDAVGLALEHEAEEYTEKVATVDASISRTERFIWIGLGGVAIIVIVVGMGLSGSITRPLERLSAGFARVRHGDYQQRLDGGGSNELDLLAQSFNDMTSKLNENERLRQEFIEQLEQKNAELERFTYTVSHDLKSPLVTVKGFLGLLEKDIQADDRLSITRDIEFLKDATDNMAQMLNDLLELSRVGRVANPSILFSMKELCEDVVKTLHGSIENRQARITIEAELPSVYADRDRIRDVLQNLIENAIKFAPEGEAPRIRIYAESRDNTTLFFVEDNGIGIDPQYHDKVFTLFERLDARASGTGIGLALVKRIIETHDGRIWIESPLDAKGTRFCFTLPETMPEADSFEVQAVAQN